MDKRTKCVIEQMFRSHNKEKKRENAMSFGALPTDIRIRQFVKIRCEYVKVIFTQKIPASIFNHFPHLQTN